MILVGEHEDKRFIQNNLNKSTKEIFNEIYLKLINEWSKNLYTPKIILDKFTYTILDQLNKQNFEFCLKMSYKGVLALVDKNNYQYYKNFFNFNQYLKENNIDNFYFYICYGDATNLNSLKFILKDTKFKNSFQDIFQIFQNDEFPAAETIKINLENSEKIIDPYFTISQGCVIIINSSAISENKKFNQDYYEQLLDHELNHYFSLLEKSMKYYKEILPDRIFKETIETAGYEVNKDLIIHLFKNSEFISMCSDVCNSIDFYLKKENNFLSDKEIYYKFISMCSTNYLKSSEFRKLDECLQRSLLFAYACRIFDKERWKDLKTHIQVQLNHPKRNIFKDFSNWLKEIFKKV